MSIIDKRSEFCDATAIPTTSDTASELMGNVMDLGSAPTLKNLGQAGQTLYWVVSIDTTLASSGNPTATFKLCSDSTANLATSKTTHAQTPALTSAVAVAGYTIAIPLPSSETYERYLGTWCDIATATVTGGKANSYLTFDPPKGSILPDGL